MSGIMNMFVATKTTIATAVDAFFNSVSLLLNTSSTNGAQNNTFLDSSTNNFTITRNGNNTQGTFTPFSQTGWGNYFDGTDDRLTTSSALLAYSTGNASTQTATIEAMVYLNAYNASKAGADENAAIVAKGSTYMNFGINHLGNLILYHYDGSVRTPTSSGTVPLNTWTHVAVTLSGGVATFYINGSSSGTGTWYGLAATSDPVYIGEATGASASAINGYLSNLRISTTARTITVPTVPYTSDASTALLTCQSNRFIDNSSNGYAITVSTGTPSVQAFSPFAPTAAYDAAVVGGSGYFDGSGDYLYAGNNSAFTMGTGDFTYECWVYHTSISGQQTYFARTNGNNNGVYFYKDTSGYPGVYITSQVATSSVALTAGQWYHLVATRLSGTLRIFINGVQTASVTNTTNMTESVCYIGADSDGSSPITGYISGARILKGTGYSSITVPTTPPTAITNTSLLTNFTNSGIFDSTAKNVLETVGNAQVSTTQAKWGTTSMYFDGTGDNLYTPNACLPATGDFTLEMWIYPASTSGYQLIYSQFINGNSGSIQITWNDISSKFAMNDGSGVFLTSSSTYSTNAWYHLAIVRTGSTFTMYVNGTSVASGTNSYSILQTASYIGTRSLGDGYFNGYIDDIRITRGYARYTANFTAPTAAFPLL